jgi:uncharacterized protein (DUF1015 family)
MAAQVVAPPYDVLSEAEARAIFAERPDSMIQVTRPEVNLPQGTDPHSVEAYAAAHLALQTLLAKGALVQEEAPCFYLYSQTWGEHRQTALMGLCSTAEYDAGTIKKHEFTRPAKEQDRVDHISGVDAQTGLVFLAYRQQPALQAAIQGVLAEPLFQVEYEGVTHSLSRVGQAVDVRALQMAFQGVDALYIADGHHRSAAASRVAQARDGAGSSSWFLCGIFPDDSLYCMAYNRLVLDMGGFTARALIDRMGEHFDLAPVSEPLPPARGGFTMYLADHGWQLVTPKPGTVDATDPVASLDVAVLQDRVLGPLLGIEDPRRDDRVQFVGGIRGPQALQDAVDAGRAQVAFHMYPTGLDQLFAVADADRVMPPKSTWFEPKLAGGILAHLLS